MGDRNNPIKFGPEWLRNMSRERSAARSSNNNQNTSTLAAGASNPQGSSSAIAGTSSGSAANPTLATSKVLLAKLRYGREEMLALYDRNAEAPPELKVIEALYQPRGKQPVALNNSFDEEMRDCLRGAPPIGGMSSGDRFGLGRGTGRVLSDGRGRMRGSYVRMPGIGRGVSYAPKVSNPRMPFGGGADEEGGPSRAWNNTLTNSNRNSGDQADWASKMFRSKRLANNTNWRQPQSREEGEEWRSSEPVRSRQLEKWDRDWGDRSSGERSQTWNTNRRTWGGDAQNDENLPEWAVENAECGGTFDSSGAFHGYSNDDTNLPKHQEPTYPLARSHTHGSFPRPKAVEEGSEEWWASEKAKKLSPKRFDASDLKFKKHPVADNSNNSASTASKANTSKGESPEPQVKSEASSATENQNPTSTAAQSEDKYNKVFMNKYPQDNKVLEGMEELSTEDDVGNFQSVLIASNNTLRQKHQHMVMAPDGQGHMLIGIKKSKSEMDHATILLAEDIVDNMFGLSMDDEEIMSNSSTGELSSVGNSMPQNMHNMSKAMPNLSGMTNDLHGHPISGMQPNVMPSGGMQSVGMQVPSGGLQTPNMPSSAVLTAGMAPVGLQNTGLPQTGMPSAGLQAPRVQTPGMQPVMQPVGITNSALNASLGLSIGPGPNIPLALQVPQQVIPSVSMASNMGVMQNPNMAAFQGGNNLPMGNNIGSTNSLFLGQNSTNPSISSSNDMPNHTGQNSMFPLHSLQHSGSQASFGNSIYSSSTQNLAEQWYYEDPERNIQGPFSSKDMYNWYRAGFFSPGLMVRRACEPLMRPLGSYGPVVPFVQMDMPGFPMTGAFESRPQGPRENMLNTQPTLGLDVDSLWGQPSTSAEPMWVQRPLTRTDVNNLPMYFWDQQVSRVNSRPCLNFYFQI